MLARSLVAVALVGASTVARSGRSREPGQEPVSVVPFVCREPDGSPGVVVDRAEDVRHGALFVAAECGHDSVDAPVEQFRASRASYPERIWIRAVDRAGNVTLFERRLDD